MTQDNQAIPDNVSAVSGQGIAEKAEQVRTMMTGKPYIYGGKTTVGFDCSGFVSWVFRQLFPNSANQYQLSASGFASSSLFSEVNATDIRAGDLIYFPPAANQHAHIGIVYDDAYWIGSQTSTGVAKVKFSNSYWGARSKKFYRLNTISVASMNSGRRYYA